MLVARRYDRRSASRLGNEVVLLDGAGARRMARSRIMTVNRKIAASITISGGAPSSSSCQAFILPPPQAPDARGKHHNQVRQPC